MEEITFLVNGVEMKEAVVQKVNKTLDRVEKKIGAIEKGYLSICADVAYLYDNKAFHVTGHKNIYDLCADRFGMARGTVSNLIKIYRHYGEDYKLPADVTARKLTELLAEIKETENPRLDTSAEASQDANGYSSNVVDGEIKEVASKPAKKPEVYTFEVDTPDWNLRDFLGSIAEQIDSENQELPVGMTIKVEVNR